MCGREKDKDKSSSIICHLHFAVFLVLNPEEDQMYKKKQWSL